jgi:hypothetical protein
VDFIEKVESAVKKQIVFTSVNLNYLSRANILGASIKKFNLDVHFVVILSEPGITFSDGDIRELYSLFDSIDEFLLLRDLTLELNESIKSLKVTEVCTAVKAEVMLQLLERDESTIVSYIDPDIMVFDDVSKIVAEHRDADILLTPHLISEPIREWSVLNNEISGAMRHGIFNLGFISCRKGENSLALLRWWRSRLLKYCREDSANSIWTDQKWFDLAPVYFNGVKIVKYQGWNMASWNLDERRLISLNPPRLENGESLLFYHFSKAPSKGFRDSVLAGLHHNYVLELAKDYEYELNTYGYSDFFIKELQEKSISSVVTTTGKNSLIHSRLLTLTKFPRLVKAIKSQKLIYRFTLIFLSKLNSPKENVNRASLNRILNFEFDRAFLSHQGGGGVEHFLSLSSYRDLKGQSYVLITPVSKDVFSIRCQEFVYSSLSLSYDEVVLLLKKAKSVEVHHLQGNETLLDTISNLQNFSIFIHDRYFLSQTPFSDTLKFDIPKGFTRGVNIPLNPEFVISEDAWRNSTRKLLEKAKSVFVPNSEILTEISDFARGCNVSLKEWEGSKAQIPMQASSSSSPLQASNTSLNIVVLGAPGVHKGIYKILEMAKLLESEKPDAIISLFGGLPTDLDSLVKLRKNIVYYGNVEHYRVQSFLRSLGGNCVGWIPSLTRESFSFAFSDFSDAQINFIATDLGALSLRGRDNPLCTLYDPAKSVSDVLRLLTRS